MVIISYTLKKYYNYMYFSGNNTKYDIVKMDFLNMTKQML